MFSLLLEWCAILLVAVLYFTQIFWPMVRGTTWFPLFRKQRVRLEQKIREERELGVESVLSEKLKELINERKK